MKKFIKIVSIFFILILTTGCTSGVIRGIVVDVDGNPIENALIQTNPPTASLLSTKDGFIFRKVPVEEYSLIATKEGYKNGSVYVDVRPGKITHANIVLKIKD